MTKVRIALAGVGGYGSYYVRELLKNSDAYNAEFVAGIEPHPGKIRQIAEIQNLQLPLFSSLGEFFKKSNADIVIVSTPIHLHASLTITALDNGSCVLCEKPLCATTKEIESMASAEKKSGSFVAIGYQLSYSMQIQKMKKDILDGKFGKPLFLKTLCLWPRSQSYYRRNGWAGRIMTKNNEYVFDSPINNANAHYLHNMLYLLGNTIDSSGTPKEVRAKLWRANDIENFDTAALEIKMADGTILYMYSSHAVNASVGPLMEYHFEKCVVEHGSSKRFIAKYHTGEVVDYGEPEEGVGNKLWKIVDIFRHGGTVPCGIRAAAMQTLVVDSLQKMPIENFSRAIIKQEITDTGKIVFVEGLKEKFEKAYEECCLDSISFP